MAPLAESLLLAFAAHPGAHLNGSNSQRARDPQTSKTGAGVNDNRRYRSVDSPVDVPIFSIVALWQAMQQILIGIALGFTMQFAFAAVRTAGELIGLQMGLSFATFFDPGSRLNMPVLARLIDMLAMLLFLTFNGHLWLISLLVDTFHTLPIGGNPVNSNAFLALARAGSLIFLNGLMLALPIMTLLLTLNLALGLLNRMAPQLSIFVIGFPLTLAVGISLMAALMPLIAPFCERLFSEIFNLLADIVSEMPGK